MFGLERRGLPSLTVGRAVDAARLRPFGEVAGRHEHVTRAGRAQQVEGERMRQTIATVPPVIGAGPAPHSVAERARHEVPGCQLDHGVHAQAVEPGAVPASPGRPSPACHRPSSVPTNRSLPDRQKA